MMSDRVQNIISEYFTIIHTGYTDEEIYTLYDSNRDEFCASFSFDPEFADRLCRLGMLPMGCNFYGHHLFLPKLHFNRSILHFENLHIPKKVRKRSAPYTVTMNQAFTECLEKIDKQHPDSWFIPPLCSMFRSMYQSTSTLTRLTSVELWEGDELVAGEMGYISGSMYTSLSGFYTKDSSGTVQMCALARLLESAGFAFWDLGMHMEYKENLGARCVSRKNFISMVEENRNRSLEIPDAVYRARDLLM